MPKSATKTGSETLAWVKEGMNSFLRDPPDSDFQRGFLASLLEVKKFLTSQ